MNGTKLNLNECALCKRGFGWEYNENVEHCDDNVENVCVCGYSVLMQLLLYRNTLR